MGSPSEPATTGPSIVTLTMNPGPAQVLPRRTGGPAGQRSTAVQRRTTRHDGRLRRPGGARVAVGDLAAADARSGRIDRPRPDRARPPRSRHPATLRRRARPAANRPAGAFNRSTTTALRFCRRLARRHPGDPNYDLRPARRTR